MRIDEFDEFQGLTPQMIREWLREQGFDMRIGGLLHAGRYLVEWEPIESAWRSTEASLYAVAQYRNQSVQSLLREINPRMRPWPSANARRGHSGPWLVTVAEDETGAIGRFGDEGWFHFNDSNILTEHEKFARYWPCDANGNKVRWPTDERGNML